MGDASDASLVISLVRSLVSRFLGRHRCSYWAWHEVEGDWYVLRCVKQRWHVTMHLIDPLNDTGLS
jgi:hypothetical protein